MSKATLFILHIYIFRSHLDEREANEKFLEAMLLIADVKEVAENTVNAKLPSNNQVCTD